MQRTFENNFRQESRRQERNLHEITMDRIVEQADGLMRTFDDDEMTTICSVRRPRERYRQLLLVLGAAGGLLAITFLFMSLKGVNNVPTKLVAVPKPVSDETFNRLFNLVLDWKYTPRSVLEDSTSPPALALQWLASPAGGGGGSTMEPTLQTRFALAVFYYSTTTQTTNWKHQQHWLSSFPVCLWYGIECLATDASTTERVQSMNLTSNGLKGSIPAEIALLDRECHVLDVSGNNIGGYIPDLSGLQNLKSLYLGPNAFTSVIPASIYTLTHLEQLYLNDCNLQGSISEDIGRLSNLQGLALYNNQLTGSIPASLSHVGDLRVLYLDGNRLTGTIPSSLCQLAELVDLRLSRNYLQGRIPNGLENMRILQFLYLDNNKLTGSVPASVGELALLNQFHLHENRVTGSIPADWSNLLTVLYLDSNRFVGTIPTGLGRLRYLQSLYLFGNALTGVLPTELGLIGGLQYLRVNDNLLTGNIPSEFTLLDNLQTFFAYNNSLSGPAPEATVADMARLERLRLEGNNFVGGLVLCKRTVPWIELTADCYSRDLSCECCTECFPTHV
jgi:Leucine-rich repeat (LRR) protein